MQKVVTFRQYHKLNIDKFRSDLQIIPFVSSPSDDTDLLHEEYMSDLSGLLDIHAPVKTKQLIKPVPSWITDEYRTAKCMRRQYEPCLEKRQILCKSLPSSVANKQM